MHKITLIISVAMITASEFLQNRLSEFSRQATKNPADCAQRIQNFCNKLSVVRNEYFRIGTFHRTQQRQDFSRNFSCKNACFECAAMLILPMFIGINGVWSALPVAELCAVAISVTFIIANAKNTTWSVYHRSPFVQTVYNIESILCPSVAL